MRMRIFLTRSHTHASTHARTDKQLRLELARARSSSSSSSSLGRGARRAFAITPINIIHVADDCVGLRTNHVSHASRRVFCIMLLVKLWEPSTDRHTRTLTGNEMETV